MRRVRILSPMAGTNFAYRVGEEVDLPDEDAEALTSEPVGEPRAEYLETTSMAAPETASIRRGRPRKY